MEAKIKGFFFKLKWWVTAVGAVTGRFFSQGLTCTHPVELCLCELVAMLEIKNLKPFIWH